MVSAGSYLVVFDSVMTLVSDAPHGREEWACDNPLTAVEQFLAGHPEFRQDHGYERLVATYCRGGFLRRCDPHLDSPTRHPSVTMTLAPHPRV